MKGQRVLKKGAGAEIVFMLVMIALVVGIGIFMFNYFNKNKKNMEFKAGDDIKIFDKDGKGTLISNELKKLGVSAKVMPPTAIQTDSAKKLNVFTGDLVPLQDMAVPTIVIIDVSNPQEKDQVLSYPNVEEVVQSNGKYDANKIAQGDPKIAPFAKQLIGHSPGYVIKTTYPGACAVFSDDSNGCLVLRGAENTYVVLVNESEAGISQKLARGIINMVR